MCGRCRHVFNAFEALKRIEDADAGEAIGYALVDSNKAAAQLAPEAAPTFSAPLPEVTNAPSIDSVGGSDGGGPLLLIETIKVGSQVSSDLRHTEAFDSDDAALGQLEQAGHTAPPIRSPLPPFPVTAPPKILAATDNPLIGGTLPRRWSPSSVWTWLAAVAGTALLLQAIYFYRSQIVQQYPQLRPSLAAACEVIGCTVSWGRDQTLIKIESSDLIEPPGRPGKILLTATLANRAATKQDYPALEVKLTDTNNAVLISRVLMPEEYLGRTPAGEEGLAPNAELYINLNLELIGKSPASGYGLRVFYP